MAYQTLACNISVTFGIEAMVQGYIMRVSVGLVQHGTEFEDRSRISFTPLRTQIPYPRYRIN